MRASSWVCIVPIPHPFVNHQLCRAPWLVRDIVALKLAANSGCSSMRGCWSRLPIMVPSHCSNSLRKVTAATVWMISSMEWTWFWLTPAITRQSNMQPQDPVSIPTMLETRRVSHYYPICFWIPTRTTSIQNRIPFPLLVNPKIHLSTTLQALEFSISNQKPMSNFLPT